MVKQKSIILDEIFLKGLKSYFNEYDCSNTKFEDFINKLVEAIGVEFRILKDLCYNWI